MRLSGVAATKGELLEVAMIAGGKEGDGDGLNAEEYAFLGGRSMRRRIELDGGGCRDKVSEREAAAATGARDGRRVEQ